jgi:hypothetical protein
LRHVLDIEAMVERDPIPAREALRRLFADGKLSLTVEEGVYVARTKLLPLVLFESATPTGFANNANPRRMAGVAGAWFATQPTVDLQFAMAR